MARARKPINKPAAGLSPELKIIGFVAVLIISGVLYSMLAKDGAENDGNSDSNSANASAQASLEGYSTEAAAHGDTDAKAVLVKYTDFQ